MQAYNSAFARIYDVRWTDHARYVAPLLREYYGSTEIGAENRRLLDVCCGTGQLAVHFLEHGYTVTGLDLSEHMLHYARQNAAQYVASGQARFVQGDAADFTLDDRYGLVLSTFDALNHLPDKAALRACFECVHRVLAPGGVFIFDLNTRAGLRAKWNGIRVQDTDDLFLMDTGAYDEDGNKAWVKITGFVRVSEDTRVSEDMRVSRDTRVPEDASDQDNAHDREEAFGKGGLYKRFTQMAYNTIFEMAWVRSALLETGYSHVHFARLEALGTPMDDPEAEGRAYIIAQG
jgi:SAM-dependent methyltransferase